VGIISHCYCSIAISSIQNRSLFLKTEIFQKALLKPLTAAFSATSKNRSFFSLFQVIQPTGRFQGQSVSKFIATASLTLGVCGLAVSPLCEGVNATRVPTQESNHVVLNSVDSDYQGTDAGLVGPKAVAQRISINQTSAPRYTSVSTSTVNPAGIQLTVPAPRTNVIPAAAQPRIATGSSYGSEQIAANFVWPTRGTLSSNYGRRWGRMHQGIDIAGPIGTPVVSAADGVVVSSSYQGGGYGNVIDVQHPDGSMTRYGHNNRLIASVGQAVKQGQHIADMGNTGRSTGPHLHFEIHPGGGSAVNPLAYLPR
jgi:murein DD-endopeptidase MepM/ murein hydrolase activator NlpD